MIIYGHAGYAYGHIGIVKTLMVISGSIKLPI